MLFIWKFRHVCSANPKTPLLQTLVLLFATFSLLIFVHGGAGATEPLLNHEKPWTGDLDGMVERHKIRVLVPYSKTFYFLDGVTQRGISYEGMQTFGKWLNKELGTGHLKVRVIMIPTARDELFSGLVAGRGDIALGNITITPERLKIVDFSDPFAKGVREIVVAGQGTPALESLDDLAGQEVFVRTSSSYYESLKHLNEEFVKSSRKTIDLLPADESFVSYNAGPARIAKLRMEAEKKGLDPNVWFRNVEIVAAKRIGRETVQYVSNIYKYYTAYRLIMDKLQLKKEAKKKKGLGSSE
jgi:membrane-bound lytic murein transglycosylase MltF